MSASAWAGEGRHLSNEGRGERRAPIGDGRESPVRKSELSQTPIRNLVELNGIEPSTS